jgi:flavin reductase (DIM6/NTAB) family NADH-FMN oxidoreductase RutF
MSIDGVSFRDVMGNFATGCTVVTLPGSPPHGMTANAFASVSLDPPLCLICVDHDTRCYDLLSTADVDSFAVNVLTEDQRDLAEHFASMDELAADPFETRPTQSGTADVPIFSESLAYLDCAVDATHPAGDHTIFVGRVRDADVPAPEANPLTFFRGDWGTVGEIDA